MRQATTTHHTSTLEDIHMNQEFLEEQVCQLLQWNPGEFNHFFYETAIAYLESYFGDDADAISKLSARRQFWKWFRNHWTYRDQVFFESLLLDNCDQAFRLNLYKGLHSPEMLACDIYPSSTVLGPEFSTIKIQLAC
jgi:hypothetical protein